MPTTSAPTDCEVPDGAQPLSVEPEPTTGGEIVRYAGETSTGEACVVTVVLPGTAATTTTPPQASAPTSSPEVQLLTGEDPGCFYHSDSEPVRVETRTFLDGAGNEVTWPGTVVYAGVNGAGEPCEAIVYSLPPTGGAISDLPETGFGQAGSLVVVAALVLAAGATMRSLTHRG